MLKATIDLFHKMEFISNFSMSEEVINLLDVKNYRKIKYFLFFIYFSFDFAKSILIM